MPKNTTDDLCRCLSCGTETTLKHFSLFITETPLWLLWLGTSFLIFLLGYVLQLFGRAGYVGFYSSANYLVVLALIALVCEYAYVRWLLKSKKK